PGCRCHGGTFSPRQGGWCDQLAASCPTILSFADGAGNRGAGTFVRTVLMRCGPLRANGIETATPAPRPTPNVTSSAGSYERSGCNCRSENPSTRLHLAMRAFPGFRALVLRP